MQDASSHEPEVIRGDFAFFGAPGDDLQADMPGDGFGVTERRAVREASGDDTVVKLTSVKFFAWPRAFTFDDIDTILIH